MTHRPVQRSAGPEAPTSARTLWAWALYDWANNALPTIVITFVFSAYFTRRLAPDAATGTGWWGLTVGLSGMAVALSAPAVGAVIDQTGRRKPWLAAFTFAAVTATALLWFIAPRPALAVPALGLVAAASFCSQLAVMVYNAMLPSLAPPDKVGRWSGWGWGLGYAGGLSALLLALGILYADAPWLPLDRDASQHVRATFVLAAVWYAVFSLPLLLLVPDPDANAMPRRQALTQGWAQLRRTVADVRRHSHILRFLLARMLYADGLATLLSFGGLFAAGTFDLSEREVLIFAIGLNVTAGLGAALFSWVDDWIGGKPTILLALAGLTAPGAAMLLVRSPALFWVFGLVLGVFVGPVQAASRSFLARIAPPDIENQVFGLYALSGKATAFIGPFLVGWLTGLTGSQRIGMSVILVFFVAGAALLTTVPRAE